MGRFRVCSGVVVPGIVPYPYGTLPMLNQANFQAVFYTQHMELSLQYSTGGQKHVFRRLKLLTAFEVDKNREVFKVDR